jgi:hypothetical protein
MSQDLWCSSCHWHGVSLRIAISFISISPPIFLIHINRSVFLSSLLSSWNLNQVFTPVAFLGAKKKVICFKRHIGCFRVSCHAGRDATFPLFPSRRKLCTRSTVRLFMWRKVLVARNCLWLTISDSQVSGVVLFANLYNVLLHVVCVR